MDITKIKSFLKKHETMCVAIFLLFCISGLVFQFYKIVPTDELFTFANTFKLHNGIQLYSDNNVIDTPLFFYLANLFLSIFGMNFFAYKLLAIIIVEIILLLSFKILRKFKVPAKRAIIYVVLFLVPFCKDFCRNGANYNLLALAFWTLGMFLIIKKDGFKINIIEQGIVSALIFATKQNIGIYYLFGVTLFTIYTYRKNIKEIIKKLVGVYGIFLIITAIWVTALIVQGQFEDFINYCFLGLGEFAERHISIDWVYAILLLITPISIIGLIIAKRKFKIEAENPIIKTSIFFLCFMIASFFIGYPIFNAYHIEMASFVSVIYGAYLIEQIVKRMEETFNRKLIKVIVIAYIIGVVIVNIYYITMFSIEIFRKDYNLDYKDPYFGLTTTEEINNQITEILNFIELKEKNNQKVIVFSEEANIYQIVLGGNNKDFDLPFLGNWGHNGEEKVLNKIKELKNTFILIKDKEMMEQDSTKIKEYIRNNYNKTGEITGYDIYYIN